jgi:sugar transferase EpsL
VRSGNESFYRRRGKRIFDLATGIAIGIVTLPIQAAVAGVVAKRLGRPVLFRQQRPGLAGKPFELVKFRTMTDARDSTGQLLPDAERLPPFGQFLRATSLDELPEIFNVVRGDMSLVGPRPLLMRYLDRYSDTEFRRHDVRPGITGLAQVSGRNAVSWPQKFALDVEYVDDVSFWMDLKILLRTVRDVLLRDGINQPGEATTAEYLGNTGMAVDSN